ncbi:MAG: GNAT family N-acetyltransferase [Deltaproteobacteria bacterium]|nr:GNAT family N-acetyltransferase [Deltaproteobacteria bacterium]
MEIIIREAKASDIEACGRIMFESFSWIAEKHRFPPELPSIEYATRIANSCITQSTTYGVVAECGGRIVGSNFIDERDSILGIGPVSVEVGIQEKGIGRRLMEAVLERGKDAPGIRLVQDSFNTVSMSLYTSMGFETKEPLVFLKGRLRSKPVAGVKTRSLKKRDLKACAELCLRVHDIVRTNELKDALKLSSAFVLIRDGRLSAYTSAVAYWGHGVAETYEDMQALLLGIAATRKEPLEFILPVRQTKFFQWCLSEGLRVIKPMTLMARGHYKTPRSCFFTSATY